MKLTEKQLHYLKHIARHGETSENRTAGQLEKKGLIMIFRKRERTEWGRTVATLSVCGLTKLGEEVLANLNKPTEE